MTYQPHDTIRARFPRLLLALRRACLLTEAEAIGCLQMRQMRQPFAGEAVDHFGGVLPCLAAAWQRRRLCRA